MDCRVWQFPTMELAAGCFLWREADAAKNSVSMLAGAHFPHGSLEGLSSKRRKEMLLEKGVDWAALEPRLRRGSFFFRRKAMRELSAAELAKIPPAHRPPGGLVERSAVVREDLPPLSRVANRVEALFEGAPPRLLSAPPKPPVP